MKVAVIVGTYNNAPHIVQAIQSVKSQTLCDWRCLIIDNGSSDASIAMAKTGISNDPRFTLIQKQNEGPSAWRNLGFSRIGSECEYVHFLDGDDVLKRDFLEILCDYLDMNTQAGIAACHYDIINQSGDIISPGFRTRYAPGFLGFPRQLKPSEVVTPFETFYSATGQGPFAVFRSSIFSQTTGYEMTFWSHEDSDIFCQMALISEVHYLPMRLYSKRVHSHNLTRSPKANYGKFREKWDFYFSSDPDITGKVDKAFRYYYGAHAPLRHLRVSAKALIDLVTTRRMHFLRWSLELFLKGISDLILKRELRRRNSQRQRVRLQRCSS